MVDTFETFKPTGGENEEMQREHDIYVIGWPANIRPASRSLHPLFVVCFPGILSRNALKPALIALRYLKV